MQKFRGGPFKGLAKGHFRTAYLDPPWRFQAGEGNRTAPYPTMTVDELKALPVGDLMHPDGAVIFCWTSGPFMRITMDLIESYGFTYVTKPFDWVKLWPREGNRLFVDWQEVADLHKDKTQAKGTGYWTLSGQEDVLLFKRGKVDWAPGNQASDRERGIGQVIFSERRQHSRKPEEVADRIERISTGPFLELFARRSRPGWTTWGNQATKFDAQPVAESVGES